MNQTHDLTALEALDEFHGPLTFAEFLEEQTALHLARSHAAAMAAGIRAMGVKADVYAICNGWTLVQALYQTAASGRGSWSVLERCRCGCEQWRAIDTGKIAFLSRDPVEREDVMGHLRQLFENHDRQAELAASLIGGPERSGNVVRWCRVGWEEK